MTSGELPLAHNAVHPKCRCCGVRVEYNSPDYRWELCKSCSEATTRFIIQRRENLKRRGLIKK